MEGRKGLDVERRWRWKNRAKAKERVMEIIYKRIRLEEVHMEKYTNILHTTQWITKVILFLVKLCTKGEVLWL